MLGPASRSARSLVKMNHDAVVLVVLYSAVALGAGLIEASGFAAGGMYLLLGSIVGSGLGLGGAHWRAAALVSGSRARIGRIRWRGGMNESHHLEWSCGMHACRPSLGNFWWPPTGWGTARQQLS